MYILFNKDKQINQREIEKKFNLSNPTVNGILNRLENKGLIKRISDEKDKRVKNIIALKETENFIEQIKIKKDQIETVMLNDIKKENLDIFYNVLEKMIYNLKEDLNERNI